MAGEDPKDIFKQQFIDRTAYAREASGLSQEEMGEHFQLKQGTWKQYETRSPLPHYMVVRFCNLVRCDIYWLYTGRGTPPEPVASALPHRTVKLRTRRRAH